MKRICSLFIFTLAACTTAPNPNDLQGTWESNLNNPMGKSLVVDGDQVSLYFSDLQVIEGEIVTVVNSQTREPVAREVAIDRPEQHVMPVFGVLERLYLKPQDENNLIVHLTFSEMTVSEILKRETPSTGF